MLPTFNKKVQGGGVPIEAEIWNVLLDYWEEDEIWKFYDNDNNDNDGQRTIFIRKAHVSLRLSWAKSVRHLIAWSNFPN